MTKNYLSRPSPCNLFLKFDPIILWAGLVVFLGIILPLPLHSQPSAVISTSTSGLLTCPLCNVQSPGNAIDGSFPTATQFNVSTALTGGWVGATYGYNTPLDSHSIICMQGYFTGSAFISGTTEQSVIGYLRINLMDANGNILTTYGQGNGVPVQLVDSVTNRIIIYVVVPMPGVRRLSIQAGGFLGVIQRNFVLEEIWEMPYSPQYVTRNTDTGYSLGSFSLCLGCTSTNPDYATAPFDPNSEFAFMRIPLGASTGNNYAFMDYDWSGAAYDGSQTDLWVVLERVNISGVSTGIINEGLFEIKATYTDSSEIIYEYGNPFLEVQPLFNGSGRFAIRVNLEDSKEICAVQVRLKDPVAAAENAIRIYSIFVEPVSPPLPFEDLYFTGHCEGEDAILSWEWKESKVRRTELEKLNAAGEFAVIQRFEHDAPDAKRMEFIDPNLEAGSVTYRLRIFDELGQNTWSSPVSLHPDMADNSSWFAFPNPVSDELTLQFEAEHDHAILRVHDLHGREIDRQQLTLGTNRIDSEHWEKGVYVLQIEALGLNCPSKMVIKR